jgi:hypothetical protein
MMWTRTIDDDCGVRGGDRLRDSNGHRDSERY